MIIISTEDVTLKLCHAGMYDVQAARLFVSSCSLDRFRFTWGPCNLSYFA